MQHRTRIAILTTALLTTAAITVAPIHDLSPTGQRAIATGAFAAILWVTGALPLAVTALCIPILLTILGVYPELSPALTGFADPVIFLLLAGFALAEALQHHQIDRRLAYRLLIRLGTTPSGLVLAVMVATATLSMIVSNTATTAMMAPVALGLSREVIDNPTDSPNLEISMLLGTAYAASIGGVATLVGSPPNAIVAATIRDDLDITVTFIDWLIVGLPITIIGTPIAWYLLTKHLFPVTDTDVTAARQRARTELDALPPLDTSGRRTVIIVATTAALWLLGGLSFLFTDLLPTTIHTTLFGGPGPSLLGPGAYQGVLYYVLIGLLAIPTLILTDAADWDDIADIDWSTLLLLGGGISLADALGATDAMQWIGSHVATLADTLPIIPLVLALAIGTILLSELGSNTAIAAVFVPVVVTIGPAYALLLGVSDTIAATFLAVVIGVAASFGFAIPVATPPNAIVYGTGAIERDHMLKAGTILDAIFALIITATLLTTLALAWPIT